MAANLPQPIFTQSRPEQRGFAESLLLQLAGAAPNLLQDFVRQRSINQQQERQGSSILAALEAASAGSDSPEIAALLGSLGGAPGDVSGIDPMQAQGAMEAFLQLQQNARQQAVAQSGIDLNTAQTEGVRQDVALKRKRAPLENRRIAAETTNAEVQAQLAEKQLEQADELMALQRLEIESAIAGNNESILSSREQRAQAQVAFVESGAARWRAQIDELANSYNPSIGATERRRLAAQSLGIPVDETERRTFWEEQAASPDPRRAVQQQAQPFSNLPEEIIPMIEQQMTRTDAAALTPQEILERMALEANLPDELIPDVEAFINFTFPGANVSLSKIKERGFMARIRRALSAARQRAGGEGSPQGR